jgi:1-acyl-sn-glycerol-3-phosphate acyltransferase
MWGWDVQGALPPDLKKCIIVVAPHTAMGDFIIGRFGFWKLQIKVNFLIKKEAFTPALGWIIKGSGGIPVDRSRGANVTAQVVRMIEESDQIAIVITPEGTREKVTHWKKGFYFLAQNANIPIALAYIDYGRKKGGIGSVIQPSGDYNADMKIIREFYRGMQGRHPERFDIDGIR